MAGQSAREKQDYKLFEEMKSKCDNDCGTCQMPNQIFCALSFSKANNAAMKSIVERLEAMEESFKMLNGGGNVISPMSDAQNDPAQAEVQEGL